MSETPISGATRLAAVIGSPVRHSLSPALHNAAFRAAGLDWRLLALEVEAGSGGAAVEAMCTLGIGGLAVTAPHKADVAAAVDEVDPAASALRSVNTVVLRPDGSTFGASTDGQGLVNALVASDVSLDGVRLVVLGAGAAARSIVDALGRQSVADIAIVNRHGERAQQAATLAEQARAGSLADLAEAHVLVNATSVGMATSDVPLDPTLLHDRLTVVDIVYHPLDTALLVAARSAGAATVNGLGMLVHQAVLQQVLWTGVSPDPSLLRSVAEAELASRRAVAAR